jgi:hypothetical protein
MQPYRPVPADGRPARRKEPVVVASRQLPTQGAFRVVVAAGDPFARRLIKSALEHAGMIVIAEARDGPGGRPSPRPRPRTGDRRRFGGDRDSLAAQRPRRSVPVADSTRACAMTGSWVGPGLHAADRAEPRALAQSRARHLHESKPLARA